MHAKVVRRSWLKMVKAEKRPRLFLISPFAPLPLPDTLIRRRAGAYTIRPPRWKIFENRIEKIL
jgi:hypothetical protein